MDEIIRVLSWCRKLSDLCSKAKRQLENGKLAAALRTVNVVQETRELEEGAGRCCDFFSRVGMWIPDTKKQIRDRVTEKLDNWLQMVRERSSNIGAANYQAFRSHGL